MVELSDAGAGTRHSAKAWWWSQRNDGERWTRTRATDASNLNLRAHIHIFQRPWSHAQTATPNSLRHRSISTMFISPNHTWTRCSHPTLISLPLRAIHAANQELKGAPRTITSVCRAYAYHKASPMCVSECIMTAMPIELQKQHVQD